MAENLNNKTKTNLTEYVLWTCQFCLCMRYETATRQDADVLTATDVAGIGSGVKNKEKWISFRKRNDVANFSISTACWYSVYFYCSLYSIQQSPTKLLLPQV